MGARGIDINFDDWEAHAHWWDNESREAAARMATNPAQLHAARRAFGIIGSSTVGAALVEVLQTREAVGNELSNDARENAALIRASLTIYGDTNDANTAYLRPATGHAGGADTASSGAGGGATDPSQIV